VDNLPIKTEREPANHWNPNRVNRDERKEKKLWKPKKGRRKMVLGGDVGWRMHANWKCVLW
jgi:hypothetical protein